MAANPALLTLLRQQLDGMAKQAFTPAPALAGDPATGGAPPVDPAMAAAGGDPAAAGGMPPGGDPAAMAAPPGDPAAAGGMPPPGLDPMLQQAITMAVQQAMQGAGGAPSAGGGKRSGSKGGDETASQLYKMNTMLTAMIEGLNRAGMDIQIPVQMMLGPPPGSDPAAAVAMASQGGAPGMPPGMPPGAPPGDPAAQAMPAAGKLAALLDGLPQAASPIGYAVQVRGTGSTPTAQIPVTGSRAPTVAGLWDALRAN